MTTEDRLKLFSLANQLTERDLDSVERKLGIDLKREHEDGIEQDEQFYPQFASAVREEAANMATYYEAFYCLEASMRDLIIETMFAEHGATWWDDCVPDPVKDSVKKNIQGEIDSAVTQRSEREIDYTTFGELGDVVRANWNSFADIFNSRRGFDKVMAVLNVLRGPIAHCNPLAADEVVRLRLAIADWFRLMS